MNKCIKQINLDAPIGTVEINRMSFPLYCFSESASRPSGIATGAVFFASCNEDAIAVKMLFFDQAECNIVFSHGLILKSVYISDIEFNLANGKVLFEAYFV